jgi:hypothetical protein
VLRDEIGLTISWIEGLVEKNVMFFGRHITSGLHEPVFSLP